MKKRFYLAVISMALILGMMVVSCDDGDDGGVGQGSLTITGLEDYNGQYVIAMGTTETITLVAAESVNISAGTITGSRVNSGRVTLNVYSVDENSANVSGYQGSDGIIFMVAANAAAAFDNDAMNNMIGMLTVNFSSGTASGAVVAIPDGF